MYRKYGQNNHVQEKQISIEANQKSQKKKKEKRKCAYRDTSIHDLKFIYTLCGCAL